MMVLTLLLLLLMLLAGVCPRRPREIYVKAGEMVAMRCPYSKGYNPGNATPIWTSYTTQEMDLTNTSSAEQKQMGLLVHGRSLVILKASVNHQGNYSCSLGNAVQYWFRATVYTTLTREFEDKITYSKTCYTQKSCKLNCPDENVPPVNTLNITSNNITWHKEGESWPKPGYFSSVEENDHGVYTCTRSYLYHGQIYNMTFRLVLDVQPQKKKDKSAVITSPRMSDVFYVDLGSTVVIDCKAVLYSDFDEVFWLRGESFVKKNKNLTVFYTYTREKRGEEIQMTTSLVFKNVAEEDLSKNYTCKLESLSDFSSFVTITLAQKEASPSSLSLALGIVIIVVVIIVAVVIHMKLKMDIALFLRDSLTCYRSTSDGKSYDAFLMCYKSDTDAGLNVHDRKRLTSVLEEDLGYSLCLYDRDVLQGKAVAEAVLDCIEQSRTVVLVPTSPDPDPGSGLLSAIHAALVERQAHLIFIKTEETEASRPGSLPDVLQLLGKAGDCVTWRGVSSMPRSSAFWKQLRYCLPAPQHASKIRLLPQTAPQNEYC